MPYQEREGCTKAELELDKCVVFVGNVKLGRKSMLAICEQASARVFDGLVVGQMFQTPDTQVGAPYEITRINRAGAQFEIQFGSGNRMWIQRESLAAALDYLLRKSVFGQPNACDIGANNPGQNAGPLDLAARLRANAPRNITYVLPILQHAGLVEIYGGRPRNQVWLA